MFMGVIIVLLIVFGIRRSMATDRSPESFAEAHGLTLDDVTRPFVTHHLARLQAHRLWGSLVGAVIGIAAGWLLGSTFLMVFVASLAGSLVGMGAAEAARYFRRSADTTPRIAVLERRDRALYMSAGARRVELIVSVLFAACAVASLALRSKTPLMVRAMVCVLAAAVLVGGRVVGRRIALRSVDVTNTQLQPADHAIRSAAIDVVGAIVAALVLCATAWLVQTPTSTGTMTVRGDDGMLIASIPDVAADEPWSVAPGVDVETITWTDARGATHSADFAAPNLSTSQGITAGVSQNFWFGFFRPLFSLLLAGWAFGEWLQVSRIPFRGAGSRRTRRSQAVLAAS
jgi:hypothetical protein